MCDVCGCGDERKVTIEVHRSLLDANDRQAAHLREHYARVGTVAINLMGSPGSGKTALLEATARELGAGRPGGEARLCAVSGDLATALDANRLEAAGIPSWSITTGTGCHLDAALVHDALHEPSLSAAVKTSDYFFIENVGNLVCPAIYDLGQQLNVVALSVTEGVDKPLKYPVMFERADLVVFTKIDLIPHLPNVDLDGFVQSLEKVRPGLPWVAVSTVTGEGMGAFTRLLPAAQKGNPRAPSDSSNAAHR